MTLCFVDCCTEEFCHTSKLRSVRKRNILCCRMNLKLRTKATNLFISLFSIYFILLYHDRHGIVQETAHLPSVYSMGSFRRSFHRPLFRLASLSLSLPPQHQNDILNVDPPPPPHQKGQ
mmetsp:Transcript_17083/g.23471  ORF Transcript_17083/g.23471 Transcript_17083/m.23471 type:complete len:119 (-) Transcript_17083:2025-2381(-)